MKNKCTIDTEEWTIFELMWNVCNYGHIVCMNKFCMYNYIFLIRKNLAVTGNTNVLVIGNRYTSDGQGLCMSLVTYYQWRAGCPSLVTCYQWQYTSDGRFAHHWKQKGPVTGKHFCSTLLQEIGYIIFGLIKIVTGYIIFGLMMEKVLPKRGGDWSY
jgi:hypothetical protein